MAKTRLNNRHRDAIMSIMIDKVHKDSYKDLAKTVDDLKEKCKKLAKRAVTKLCKESDMKVLKSYGYTISTSDLRFSYYTSQHHSETFQITVDEAVDSLLDIGWRRMKTILLEEDHQLVELFKEFKENRDELRNLRKDMVVSYRTFVQNCRYWEDVLEEIPELESKASTVLQERATALMDVSVVNAVRADVRRRSE